MPSLADRNDGVGNGDGTGYDARPRGLPEVIGADPCAVNRGSTGSPRGWTLQPPYSTSYGRSGRKPWSKAPRVGSLANHRIQVVLSVEGGAPALRSFIALLHCTGTAQLNLRSPVAPSSRAQQSGLAPGLLRLLDALGDIVERCDRLLRHLHDHVADLHAPSAAGLTGSTSSHHHALRVLADVVLGAQLVAERQHEDDEGGARWRRSVAVRVAILAFARALPGVSFADVLTGSAATPPAGRRPPSGSCADPCAESSTSTSSRSASGRRGERAGRASSSRPCRRISRRCRRPGCRPSRQGCPA